MTIPKYVINQIIFDKDDNVRFIPISLSRLMEIEGVVSTIEGTWHESDDHVWCSNCESVFYKDEDGDFVTEYSYCPSCGARMRGIKWDLAANAADTATNDK